MTRAPACDPQPACWVLSDGGRRVATSTLGHDRRSLDHPGHRALLERLLRGCWLMTRWTARADHRRRERGAMSREIVVTTHEQALEVYRNKDLRQALYDDGDVVMGDVLVNLHGEDHRARRRLENRLFRRPALLHYERDLFPGIMETTLRPHVEAGEADLVSLGPPAHDEPGRPSPPASTGPRARPRRPIGSTPTCARSSRARPSATTPATATPSGPRWPTPCCASTTSSWPRPSTGGWRSWRRSRRAISPRTPCRPTS